uniref:Ovule protein n=1 Tax=Meloidogyne incognita TaxID=6306 RepID=A0A914LPM0_MELIC
MFHPSQFLPLIFNKDANFSKLSKQLCNILTLSVVSKKLVILFPFSELSKQLCILLSSSVVFKKLVILFPFSVLSK